jgi:hypothetical protein
MSDAPKILDVRDQEVIEDLLRRGARVTRDAMIAAAQGDHASSARLIADALIQSDPTEARSAISILVERAARLDADADRIDGKQMSAGVSPEHCREEAQRLRDVRRYLEYRMRPSRQSWAPWGWNGWRTLWKAQG